MLTGFDCRSTRSQAAGVRSSHRVDKYLHVLFPCSSSALVHGGRHSLFVVLVAEESDDFVAKQVDERLGEHRVGHTGVFEVVVRLFDHLQQRRQQPTILKIKNNAYTSLPSWNWRSRWDPPPPLTPPPHSGRYRSWGLCKTIENFGAGGG